MRKINSNKSCYKNKKSIINIIFYLIIIILTILINDIRILTYLSIFQLLINVSIIKRKYDFFSLPVIFIIFTYVTHLGHFFLYSFNITANIPEFFNIMKMFENIILLKTEKIIILSQVFLVWGLNFYKVKKIENQENNIDINQIKLCKNISIVFIIIGFIPSLYLDISRIIVFLNEGYLSTYNIIYNGFIQVFANFFKFGIIFMIIAQQNKPKIAKRIFICFVGYLLLTMISGHRLNAIVLIITSFYIFYKTNDKKKISLKYFIFAFIILLILNYIANFRNNNIELSGLIYNWKMFLSNNLFMDSIAEYGVTVASVCYSIIFFNSFDKLGLGLGYLTSFTSILPSITGIIDKNWQKYMVFTYNIPYPYSAALGGTYIGELYYNFYYFGIVLTFIVGILIAFVSDKLYKSIVVKNYVMTTIYISLFPFIIIWVRGYFRDLIRTFVWQLIIIGIIVNVSKIKK